jgi:hypothetical protein
VVPPARIPRVEVGSITGQPLDGDATTGGALQEVRHGRTPVNRRAVPNHPQPRSGVTQQVEQELHHMQTAQRFRSDQDIHLPGWRQPAHDRQVVTGLPLVENRRFASGSVGPNLARQKVESRFVHENQGSALSACLPPQLWPDQAPPSIDGILIPLDGPRDGNLRGPAQTLENPRHLGLAVAGTEFLLEYSRDSPTGPNVATEPVGFGSVPKEVRNQTPLFGAEPCRASGDWMRQQSLNTATRRRLEPLTDGTRGDIQSDCNLRWSPTQLLQTPSLEPTPFQTVGGFQ